MTGTPEGDRGGATAGDFAGAGVQLAVCIVGGLYLGQWLDRRFGTTPWLLIAGVVVGASAGFYALDRKLMAAQAREEQRKP